MIIVAYIDNQPTGYLVGYDRYDDSSFYCWMVGVIPDFRRKEVLSNLIDHLEKWAKLKGYEKIRIKTRNHRRSMLFFLVKSNFNFTEIFIKDKPENNEVFAEKEI